MVATAMLLIVLGGCGHPADNEQLVAADSLLAHNRGENELCRIILLQPAEDCHIFLHTVVGKLLDVLKSYYGAVVSGNGGEPR